MEGVTESFASRFAAVRSKYGPLSWGLDPSGSLLADWELGDTPDGLDRFADIVLEAAVGTVGLVKPQAAFYERHGWRGFRTLQRLIVEARSAGLLVIVDAKRGDVGSTNDAYAEAFLGPDAPLGADALTVHPYLGLGAMGAFVNRANDAGSCLLVVTRSSNPEGRAIQSAVNTSGLTTEEQLLVDIGALDARLAPGRDRADRRRRRAHPHRSGPRPPLGAVRVPRARSRHAGRQPGRRGARVRRLPRPGRAERLAVAPRARTGHRSTARHGRRPRARVRRGPLRLLTRSPRPTAP